MVMFAGMANQQRTFHQPGEYHVICQVKLTSNARDVRSSLAFSKEISENQMFRYKIVGNDMMGWYVEDGFNSNARSQKYDTWAEAKELQEWLHSRWLGYR